MAEVTDSDLASAFDRYYPVIRAARRLKRHYLGALDGVPRVAPDESVELFKALAEADAKGKIVREDDEDFVDHRDADTKAMLDDLRELSEDNG